MIDRICFPRPCELPKANSKHRGCVIFCPWCESLYRQKVHDYGGGSEWVWQQVAADEARMHLKANNG